MNQILLTNIQRFSLHDGPGIRTTVFLKGCSLRCPWCSNPENLISVPEEYIKDGIAKIYGSYYTAEELARECLKDKNFYGGKLPPSRWSITEAEDIDYLPGGVTFSGGECLLQMNKLAPVWETLHEQAIHIAAETCLFVPKECVKTAINHIDFFYVDVKILDKQNCKEVECGDLSLYLSNFDILLNSGLPIVIRVPVIGTYTDGKENRKAIHDLLGSYKDKIIKIELIKEHNLGASKYKSLGMPVNYHGVSDERMDIYKDELDDLGIPVEVCKI